MVSTIMLRILCLSYLVHAVLVHTLNHAHTHCADHFWVGGMALTHMQLKIYDWHRGSVEMGDSGD